MRSAIVGILVVVLAMFLVTGALGARAGMQSGEMAESQEPVPAVRNPAAQEDAQEAPQGSDGEAFILCLDGENVNMTMRDYLIGTLAAEMPAGFQPEALKAQAVAARTYAMYKIQRGDSAAHPGAPLCGDAGCCAAYQAPEALLEKWGAAYYENLRAITSAVDDTAGLCLAFQNAPILAVFHSSSGGMTESCAAVWGTELPYLVSVSSPEGEAETESSVKIAWAEFLETVQQAYPETAFGENRADWAVITVRTESGRVAELQVGGVTISGMDFRFLFGLRSTDFQLEAMEDGLQIRVSGYGHGVGMSQYGAETMAENGSDFQQILGHYYPGSSLVPLAISDIMG